MSEVDDRAQVPQLVVSEPPPGPDELFASALAGLNPIGMLLAVLTGSGEDAKAALRTLLRSLIEEGRRFAATPAGQRWTGILADSPAVDRGWLLWSHANIDLLLRNAARLPDNPAMLLEAALQQLAAIDIAKLMSELSRLGVELDSGDPAGTATRS
jgi:hypothetical protein